MNIKCPRVSVTITTYNRLDYLPQAINSVLDQTYRDFELIVVENGSTDGTKEWLAANPHPQMRVIVLPENIGVFGGMNTGIQAATGEYLTWLGSDDYLAIYHLEAFVAALDSDPSVDYAYSPFYVVDEKGEVYSITSFNIMLLREIISSTHRGNGGFMYKRKVHDEVGLFEGETERMMWTKILLKYKLIHVMEPTIYYRVHTNTASVNSGSKILDYTKILMRYFFEHNNNAVSADTLIRLYPALTRKPEYAAMAISDFACRIFASGFPVEALTFLKGILSQYGQDDLLRPMLNFIAIAKLSNIQEMEVVRRIAEALGSNGNLNEKERKILNKTAGSLISLYALKQKPDFFFVDSNAMPLRCESPSLFSYLNWKNGGALPPLPCY